MREYSTDAAKITTFLEAKAGAVHVRVYGPRIGYRWIRVRMWRWEKHPTTGEWQESTLWRDSDWPNVMRLARKVEVVLAELSEREAAPVNPYL